MRFNWANMGFASLEKCSFSTIWYLCVGVCSPIPSSSRRTGIGGCGLYTAMVSYEFFVTVITVFIPVSILLFQGSYHRNHLDWKLFSWLLLSRCPSTETAQRFQFSSSRLLLVFYFMASSPYTLLRIFVCKWIVPLGRRTFLV